MTPPRGCALTTTRSAAPTRATASGSDALRTLSSAAIGMPQSARRSRSSTSSSTSAHGCSRYSRSNSARACTARSASSTFQPPFASSRTRPSEPIAARTARTRATSSARVCPRSATLTFAVRQPSNRASTADTSAAVTAGTVAFTGTRSRRAAGWVRQPKSIAAASQTDASSSPYSRKGENSVHPSGPRRSSASRWLTPRNRVTRGRETTRAAARRSARSGRSMASILPCRPVAAGPRGPGVSARRTRCAPVRSRRGARRPSR